MQLGIVPKAEMRRSMFQHEVGWLIENTFVAGLK